MIKMTGVVAQVGNTNTFKRKDDKEGEETGKDTLLLINVGDKYLQKLSILNVENTFKVGDKISLDVHGSARYFNYETKKNTFIDVIFREVVKV